MPETDLRADRLGGSSIGELAQKTTDTGDAALFVIHQLRDAYDAAFACGRDAWDFSIELIEMQKAGVETHVLRMLICKDWIVHTGPRK